MYGRGLIWAGLALSLAPGPSRAADTQPTATNFALTWHAPPGCPDEAAVRADTLQLVGEQRTLHQLTAMAKVNSVGPARWELELSLQLDGVLGERHLSADSCASVAQAAAAMFALMLNPEAPVEAQPTANPAPTSPARLAFEVELGPGLGLGIVPSPDPELNLGVGLHLERAQLWLAASAGLPHDLDVVGDAGGRVRWTALGPRACWTFGEAALTLAPCVVGMLNRLQGRGHGVRDPQDGAIAWVGVGAGATGYLALHSNVGLYLQLDATAPLARPRMYLEDLGELVRPSNASLHLALGVRYRF